MAAKTNISWTGSTMNFWVGCYYDGEDCIRCYAEEDVHRFQDGMYSDVDWGAGGPRHRTSKANWRKPYTWNRKAFESREPWRVFTMSYGDFLEDNPQVAPWREEACCIIEDCKHLDWQLLSKRHRNARKLLPRHWLEQWPAHVHAGTSCGHPDYVRRIEALLDTPAPTKFLSIEPYIKRLDLEPYLSGKTGNAPAIAAVIVGGESGPKARPMHGEWVDEIYELCTRYGVIFHFKQWGEYVPTRYLWSANLSPEQVKRKPLIQHDGQAFVRVGRKVAGHLYQRREFLQMPVTARGVNFEPFGANNQAAIIKG